MSRILLDGAISVSESENEENCNSYFAMGRLEYETKMGGNVYKALDTYEPYGST
jgi:hypothetical protein